MAPEKQQDPEHQDHTARTDYRLRNHIPLGAPATREPCDGTEPSMRVSLGFTPRWYHSRLGVDFSRRWHTDPVYRYDALVQMKEHLHASFPRVDYFTPRYNNAGVEPTCATISGAYGIMLIPAIYGLEIDYRVDNWPDAAGGMTIPKEALAADPKPDLDASPIVAELFSQIEQIAERWGAIHGYLNYQGILNLALKIRGNEIFMDMYDDPDFARRLFSGIAETIANLSQRVQARQRESGFDVNLLSMSNCVINMISPADYEQFILPHDKRLSEQYQRFGIHTCNWNADPYLDQLRSIEKMGYLDTGAQADLARIRRRFPDSRRAVLYSPVDLEEKSEERIEADLTRIAQDYAPCDVVLADVEATAPDDRVSFFLDTAARLSAEFDKGRFADATDVGRLGAAEAESASRDAGDPNTNGGDETGAAPGVRR